MEPEVTRLLEASKAAYERCSSYRDSGEVVTVFIHDEPRPHRRTTIRPFKTLFVRPARFRFEFREQSIGPEDEWDRYVVTWQNGVARTSWTVTNKTEERDSLGLAIAGATGVSGGSAFCVPSLLLPNEIFGTHVFREDEWTLESDEPVDGEACARLRCTRERGEEIMWIGRKTWLIRRVFERETFDAEFQRRLEREANAALSMSGRRADEARDFTDFRTETTTRYRPQFDVHIDPAEFEATA
ncbi:MAG: hypothetical protein ACKVZJ_15305 [Phycisphaerales bacterium]